MDRDNAQFYENNATASQEDGSNKNTVLVVLGCEVALIGPHDYPEHYVNMKHPLDHTIMDNPIEPEFIVHKNGIRTRLIFRMSWRSGDSGSKYVPMSFIVDTGVPFPFYFGQSGLAIMRAHRLLVDDDNGNQFVHVQHPDGTVLNMQYLDTPPNFEPANLIGLRFLLRFPMIMTSSSFTLQGLGRFF